MDNFNLDELMDLAEAYVGPMVDAIYRRLMERDFALEEPEVVMLLTALINILGHYNRGDRVDGSIWREGSTRPPEYEGDEVLETGLSQGVTWRMSLDWEVLGLTNQGRCLCPPSPNLG